MAAHSTCPAAFQRACPDLSTVFLWILLPKASLRDYWGQLVERFMRNPVLFLFVFTLYNHPTDITP
jgi:hypothetical protein